MTEPTIEELIEASSLGTPGAKAIRKRTPPEVRDRIVAEIERRREEEQHDRMWGEGNWIVHEGCPDALEAGQERAIHHKEYHCD